MTENHYKDSALLKALAHPVRLKIVEGLMDHECNVNKIVASLKLPQSTVSQHLGILKSQKIVSVRKDGVKTCYRVVDGKVRGLLKILQKGRKQ
jgi:DNA-binding transcriptional ArsR family regulator